MTADKARQPDHPAPAGAGGEKRSLMQSHARRVDVPILLLLSAGLLIAGLLLPVLHTEKLVFWHDSYSILTGILALVEEGYYVLAAILFLFSMIFPAAKLIMLTFVWLARFEATTRARMLRRLEIVGRWSMLDVFVVAVFIVATQLGWLISAEPRIGLYLFAAAVLMSMIATMIIEKLASRTDGRGT
jgi:paraquat-inducible protein A